ncbi:hypothetical protein KVR01_011799 [Diaporthe batatas]|uniref:uncharacterized protein n=1 Tax=Diaporthe batatas TaxID=748121 RepID=UPI001D047F6E|nr:uncharacterized protein KVR01_011799 [Diaporthe batatas]KAG8158677.1 hypothetical protein KVR01_011799 [Diaporthe batatas]
MSSNVYVGLLVALTVVLGYCFHLLTPLSYPGDTPYNQASIGRPLGDLSHIKSHACRTSEFSDAMFSTARRLRSPVAQLLLARSAPPAFNVDGCREAEDILVRRTREFYPSELTTPALRAQKRMWSDAMSHDFLRRVVAPNTRGGIVELVGLWRLKAAAAAAAAAGVGREQVFDGACDLSRCQRSCRAWRLQRHCSAGPRWPTYASGR